MLAQYLKFSYLKSKVTTLEPWYSELILLIGHEIQVLGAKHPMYLIFLPQILNCLNRKPILNKVKQLSGRQ